MDLTSISQIRNHLNRISFGDGDIRNQLIKLESNEYSGLPHGHIVIDSESVKALENDIPSSEEVTLNDDPVLLAKTNIVSGSVVCASNNSLSVIYQENTDFTIDYSAGKIVRINGGAIASGEDVYVWYLHYHTYQRGVDYSIDYERGRLKRVSGGGIEDGQEVMVDYQLGSSEFSDAEIAQCITEADAEIMHTIDPEYIESTDPALQTAATYLSLSLLCRNAAGVGAGGNVTDRRLSIWMDLSLSYRETAVRLLRWFRIDIPGLNSPKLA